MDRRMDGRMNIVMAVFKHSILKVEGKMEVKFHTFLTSEMCEVE
jgi:hypothetical protein